MNRDRACALPGVLVIGLGASIAPMDFAVNVAFPAISAAFALEVQAIRWLIISYVVTYASLMLAFGKLGDIIGHRRIFRAGLIVGMLALAACALAPSYAWLLAARVVQGISTALVLSCAPALVVSLCDEHDRTWALSRYAMTGALAGILGPVMGGASIEWMGWAGVFWFRVPIALLTLVLLSRLPRLPERASATRPFDRTSSALLTAGLALLLSAPALWPVTAGVAWLAAAGIAGSALLVAFVLRERKAAEPMLPPAAIRDPAVFMSSLASVAVNFTGFAVPLLVPYYLARIDGTGTFSMGLLLAVSTLGVLAASTIAPRVVHALAHRGAALLGMVMVALAQLAIAWWPPMPAVGVLAAALFLHGLGYGLFQVSYTDLIVAALPHDDRGVAGSLSILTRTIGVVFAAAVLSSALQVLEAGHLAAGRTPAQAFHAAFSTVFLYSTFLLAGFIVICGSMRRAWQGRGTTSPLER